MRGEGPGERERETKGSQRDRTIERPFPLDCREREPKGDFVRMLAQIQIGELGVENDSAKESSIGEPTAPENDALDPRLPRWNPRRLPGATFVRSTAPLLTPTRQRCSITFDKKLYFSIFDNTRSIKTFLRMRVPVAYSQSRHKAKETDEERPCFSLDSLGSEVRFNKLLLMRYFCNKRLGESASLYIHDTK